MSQTIGPTWGSRCPRYDMELVCRVNGAADRMLRGALLASLRIYWPPERFGRIALVFDDESDGDVQVAAQITKDYTPLVRTLQANRSLLDIGGGPVRLEHNKPHGYNMQQYDTMHMDLFSEATYVGIVDSDSLLVTPPTESDFFDENGLPRVIPRVETPTGLLWEGAAAASFFMIGKPQPFRCMSHFPVIWKRSHFPLFRSYVEKVHGKPFGAVYHDMVQMCVLVNVHCVECAYRSGISFTATSCYDVGFLCAGGGSTTPSSI